jgi:D-serine deaminase-like pyridoxal phosphate-dependent protein
MNDSVIGRHQSFLDTPALTIDINLLKQNIFKMAEHGKAFQLGIRPHCKTHKCSKIALMQQEAGAIGISAAKLSEAEVLIKHGIHSVLITSPIVSINKMPRLLACLKQANELILVIDNPQNAMMLNQLGLAHHLRINVLVDIDGGIGRTGVGFNEALDFARYLNALPALKLRGIQCYAGHLQHVQDYQERRTQSLAVMTQAAKIRQLFIEANLDAGILTGTGTGTYDIDVNAGVSEIQPGSYVVMDVEYGHIGSKNKNDAFNDFACAMHLKTSVISTNHRSHVTVDAGTKSIYLDMNHIPQIVGNKHLNYHWGGFGDEHGKITSKNGLLPRLGEQLSLILPHCDPSINLYDQFFIIDDDIVVDIWDIDMRGKSQ